MKILLKKAVLALTAATLLMAPASYAGAQEVTIGYQGICNPWKWKIDDGSVEKATGYKINWRKFDSGGAVMNAMASGDVHVAVAGSSPIAAGVTNGVDVQVFWVLEDIAAAEALVVRDGSGIVSPQDMKGKTIGVPFVSTTHFHMLFALESNSALTPKMWIFATCNQTPLPRLGKAARLTAPLFGTRRWDASKKQAKC